MSCRPTSDETPDGGADQRAEGRRRGCHRRAVLAAGAGIDRRPDQGPGMGGRYDAAGRDAGPGRRRRAFRDGITDGSCFRGVVGAQTRRRRSMVALGRISAIAANRLRACFRETNAGVPQVICAARRCGTAMPRWCASVSARSSRGGSNCASWSLAGAGRRSRQSPIRFLCQAAGKPILW